MPYKINSKLRHNGKYYNPSPGATYPKKTKTPDGVILVTTPMSGWTEQELSKAKGGPQINPPRFLEDAEITEAQAEVLIKDGVLERITDAERKKLEKGAEKAAADEAADKAEIEKAAAEAEKAAEKAAGKKH